jgi:hypothetical protein
VSNILNDGADPLATDNQGNGALHTLLIPMGDFVDHLSKYSGTERDIPHQSLGSLYEISSQLIKKS